MKLSVAMRVILGFAVITMLLLFSGINSLRSLATVEESQQQLMQVAEPIQSGVNTLQLKLALSRERLLETFYQESPQTLNQYRAKFISAVDVFNSTFKELKSNTAKAPQFNGALGTISSQLSALQTKALQALSHKENYLKISQKLTIALADLSEQADNINFSLMDLSDEASSLEGKLSRDVAAQANALEEPIIDFLTYNQELLSINDVAQLKKNALYVQNKAKELKNSSLELAKAKTEFSRPELIEDALQAIHTLIAKTTGSHAIYQLQQQRLEERAKAKQSLDGVSQQSEQLTSQLNQLTAQITHFSEQSQQQVESQVSTGSRINTIVMLVSVLFAAGISLIVVRSIVSPLKEVNRILNIVASGNLTQRLEYRKDDEFGELANNVNILVDNLRELINGIVERSTQLGAAAEQTSAVTEQSTRSIEQQRSMVEQVATATTEMSSSAQQVVNSANDTLGAIKHADDEAEHVKQLSQQNRETMLSLASEVQRASDVIDQLHDDSTSISSILDVIRGIAEQTNLLALNAAIEAARAGEQGRGFAVVADEVRSLASRTQESTQEIHDMIEKLQSGAQQAVAVMSQGQEMATTCVKQVEDSTHALEVITDSVHHAHDISNQINHAAEEQTDVTSQISEQLEQIVSIAVETSEGSKQTAEANQQVALLSEQLKDSISRFTV